MKSFIILLLLFSIRTWALTEEARTFPAVINPVTGKIAPFHVPGDVLETGQRYRIVVYNLDQDGTLETHRFIDFTYTGPTHPFGLFRPFESRDEKTVFDRDNLPSIKIFNPGSDGTPDVSNDQPWLGGSGLDNSGSNLNGPGGQRNENGSWVFSSPHDAEFGIAVDPNQPPPPLPKNPKQKPKPENPSAPTPPPNSRYGQDARKLGSALGANAIFAAMDAFMNTPEDQKQQEEFNKRQNEIFARQSALEQELIDHKVDGALSVVRALSMFGQIAPNRPSPSEVQQRLDYAHKYGDPEFRSYLKGPPKTDLESPDFFKTYGSNVHDFLTKRYSLASRTNDAYILMHGGVDENGHEVSVGTLVGIGVNFSAYVTDPAAASATIYGFVKGVVRVAPLTTTAVVAAIPLMVRIAPLVTALYPRRVDERDVHFNVTSEIQDPGLKNAARVFYNGHAPDGDNLAVSALGERVAAFVHADVPMTANAKAKEMFDFVNDWIARNLNGPIVDRGMANDIRDKLKLSLQIKIPESKP